MTVESLFSLLSSHGITLYLEGDALRFRAPKGALTAELKEKIVEHRNEIITQLRTPMLPSARAQVARCRCEMNLWIDEPPHEGRIRTHCGKCGRFIGYRPVTPRMA